MIINIKCCRFHNPQLNVHQEEHIIKEKVSSYCIKLIKLLAVSLKEATCATLRDFGNYCNNIRLWHNQPWHIRLANTINVILLIFQFDSIICNIFMVIWNVIYAGFKIIVTTMKIFIERLFQKQINSIKHFMDFNEDNGINFDHLKATDTALDVTGVPPEITIDMLIGFFNQIDFTNKESVNYVPSSFYKDDGNRQMTEPGLRGNINIFIERVKGRTAFLGTPPSFSQLLDAFYEQIEGAIRLSIHKITKDLNSFEEVNNIQNFSLLNTEGKLEAFNRLSENNKKVYKNLLNERARVVLDLAIAGGHCGARYMSDTMTVHQFICGSNVEDNGSLKDYLINLLANKRKDIAVRQSNALLGNDAHSFGKYMKNMGGMLGIPGSKNIIEHMQRNHVMDITKMRDSFFKVYTEDFIIDVVQEELKKSSGFREKFIDWLKDQVGDWNKENYDNEIDSIIEQITIILNNQQIEKSKLMNDFEKVQDLISYLIDQKLVPLEVMELINENWGDFIRELFTLKEAKQWIVDRCQNPEDLVEKMTTITNLKKLCSQDVLSEDIIMELKKAIAQNVFTRISLDVYQKRFCDLEKITKIQRVINLEDDTLIRVSKKEIDLKEVVQSCQDRERSIEFLDHLNIEDEISLELIDRFLVDSHVLNHMTEERIQ